MEMELSWAARCSGMAFFALAFFLAALGGVLALVRRWPWCSCHVCRAYISGSWARDFPNLGDWYAHLLRESPTGTVHVHVLGCTVTANPANVEYMLKTNFDNFPKGKPFAAVLGDLLGGGIFNVDGDAWRHQRKMASLELGSVSVRSYAYGIIAQEVERRLVPVLAEAADRPGGAVVDLQDVFRRFAFDTICKISFGLDPGCLEPEMPMSRFADAFDAASRLCAARGAASSPLVWKAKRLLNVGSERELRRNIALVDELAAAMIRERRKLGVANSHDLLSRFMASSSSSNGEDDDKYLRDIVVSFLLAGRDTVSSALTTLFMLLSNNPEVVAAMRAEAPSSETPLTYERLKGLHYTHAALYENMRLFPPVQFDSKFCAAADVLPDGTYVPRGARVMYHPYAMGRMPGIWGPDHADFRPERWLTGPGGTFVPQSLYKYPVFQAGLRVCIGKELAVTEMKAVAVAVVRAFDVQVVGESACGAPRFVSGLTASVNGGLPVRITRVRN